MTVRAVGSESGWRSASQIAHVLAALAMTAEGSDPHSLEHLIRAAEAEANSEGGKAVP